MKIYDISIKNFRGIQLLENLRCGQINTYVGKNDSGKSSILKALSAFFNNDFTDKDVYYGIGEGEFTEIKIRFEPSFQINNLATDSEGKVSLIKRFSFSGSKGKAKAEFFYECNDINTEEHQNCWGKKEADLNNSLQNLGIEYSRSGRGVTNIGKIEQIDQATETAGRVLAVHPAEEFIKNINKAYEDFEFPEFSLFDAEQNLNVGSTDFQNQFKPIATASLNNNSGLTEQIETNVKADLEKEFNEITQLMQKNVPDLEKINTNVNCNWNNLVKFDLSLKFSSEAFDIPISHKGTGFKRLLMVAYFEYLAQKQNKRNQIFGIEEPETYLHPELQFDLLSSIITISDDSQFFLTTHSPIFAGATDDSNIVIVRKPNHLSEYYHSGNAHDVLNMAISELGIRPNYNLLNDNYRKVVFVEGANDCTFWRIAFDKINGSVPDDILFVPCGGSQVEFFVNADLCQKINRRFIVIVDSDKGAIDFASKQANNDALKTKVESVNGEFEILRKREIENYYHLEAIKRLIPNPPATINLDSITIGEYNDVKDEIQSKILDVERINFKKKNNMQVFLEMTRDEWIESALTENGSTDIQIIIDKILEE
ncbi:MAG: AAA family ATPase [Saprospiraceae bacterium]